MDHATAVQSLSAMPHPRIGHMGGGVTVPVMVGGGVRRKVGNNHKTISIGPAVALTAAEPAEQSSMSRQELIRQRLDDRPEM